MTKRNLLYLLSFKTKTRGGIRMRKNAFSKIIKLILISTTALFPMTAFTIEDNEDIIIGKYHILHSEIFNEDRPLSIYLPIGYEDSNDRYPVIYLLDGQITGRFMKTAAVMEELDGNGKMPQAIVVGVHATNMGRDYWPVPFNGRPNTGQAGNFVRFFSEELIPWIDKNYRTVDFNILCGASNSGLFASYAALTRPTLFSAYIAASPSIGWETEYMIGLADSLFQTGDSYNTYLFMNYATDDFARLVTDAMPAWNAVCETKAPPELKWELRVMENAGHVPYTSINDGLLFIFDGWKYPEEQLKSGGLDGVREHYLNLSEKYGFEVKLPSSVLMDLAMEYFNAEEWETAIDVFDVYTTEYPKSLRAHYYMAETYLRKADTSSARLWLEKSLKIDSTFAGARRKLETLGE
jgi:predicted alpha/beta superfamily hydrolase